MSIKVLHILDHSLPLHSGYSFRTMSILREQRARGWEALGLTTPKHGGNGTPRESIENTTFYRSPPLTRRIAALPFVREAAIIRTTTRRIVEVAGIEKPDILHAHSPALNGVAALQAGRKLGIPVLYELRGLWEDAAVDHGTVTEGSLRYRLSRALETYVLRRCDAVTTICEGLRQDIVGRGLPPGKVTIIPNAVDASEFRFAREDDEELRCALELQGKVVLGFIGSWYAYEGLDLLVRALPRLRAARPDMVVLLAGGGPAEASLREQARALHVDSAIRFVGRVPHAEVARYYDLVDLLIYPRHSMRLTELVTPLKPLEAMARGRIVVASDVGGHRELVNDAVTGFLFRADQPESLCETVLRVLARRDAWPEIQRAARNFIEQQRTWRESVARYQRVYGSLLKAKQSTA